MKRLLKILGIVGGVLVILVGAFVGYVQINGIPTYDRPQIAEMKVEVTPQRVANGQRMAKLLCVQCHADENGRLTGKLMKDAPKEFGLIYSKNITHDTDVGIGSWTDGQLYYFLRTGVRADGTYTPPYMPKFPRAADEDIKDIIAWLRSDSEGLEPTKDEAPPVQPSLLTKILCNTMFGPIPLPSQAIARPDTTDMLKLGAYIADGVMDCYGCHSSDFKTVNALVPTQSEGYYGGGNPLLNMEGGVVPSSNLTFDETGIGKYSESDFVMALRFGKKLDGTGVRYPMVPMPYLTERECKAVYAFLKTVPKIKNEVKHPK